MNKALFFFTGHERTFATAVISEGKCYLKRGLLRANNWTPVTHKFRVGVGPFFRSYLDDIRRYLPLAVVSVVVVGECVGGEGRADRVAAGPPCTAQASLRRGRLATASLCIQKNICILSRKAPY